MEQNVRYYWIQELVNHLCPSYMYLCCKFLHSLSKFALKAQRIQVGDEQFISVLFTIPIIIDIHGHRFKIFTLVSEINENVDLVIDTKYIFELEGILNS